MPTACLMPPAALPDPLTRCRLFQMHPAAHDEIPLAPPLHEAWTGQPSTPRDAPIHAGTAPATYANPAAGLRGVAPRSGVAPRASAPTLGPLSPSDLESPALRSCPLGCAGLVRIEPCGPALRSCLPRHAERPTDRRPLRAGIPRSPHRVPDALNCPLSCDPLQLHRPDRAGPLLFCIHACKLTCAPCPVFPPISARLPQ